MCDWGRKRRVFALPLPLYTQSLSRGLGFLLITTKPVVASFGSSMCSRAQTCQNPDFHVCELCFLLPVMWGTKCLTWKPHADVNWFSPDKETAVEVYWIWSPETKNKFLTPSQDSGTSALTSAVSTDTALSALSLFFCCHAIPLSLSLSLSSSLFLLLHLLSVWVSRGKARSGAVRGWSSLGLSRDRCGVRALIKRVTAPLQEIWPLELLSLTLNPKSNSTEGFYSLTVSALHKY